MERINPNSTSNPLIRVTRDDLLQWLGVRLEVMGYSRMISAVQINVQQPLGGALCESCGYTPTHCSTCGAELKSRQFHHHEVPELIVMISNKD